MFVSSFANFQLILPFCLAKFALNIALFSFNPFLPSFPPLSFSLILVPFHPCLFLPPPLLLSLPFLFLSFFPHLFFFWHWDLNPGPSICQANILPLGYITKPFKNIFLRLTLPTFPSLILSLQSICTRLLSSWDDRSIPADPK